jgi:hypothetical protein
MAGNSKNKKGQMSVSEAGKKGGEQTRKTHDDKFYEENGRAGGEARAQQRESDQ